jgi:hypothetical protein
MRGFDIAAFADVASHFKYKSRIVPKPRTVKGVIALPQPAPLIVHAVDSIHPDSKFLPRVTSRFLPLATPEPVFENLGNIEASTFYKEHTAPKARGTLKLKTQIELPPIEDVSKRSTKNDLAAAFKAEMKIITEKKESSTKGFDIIEVFSSRNRRHPLSQKSWKELAAEAEKMKPQSTGPDFDLAAAFKREMQAILAVEEKSRDGLSFKAKTAFEPKVMVKITMPHPSVKIARMTA